MGEPSQNNHEPFQFEKALDSAGRAKPKAPPATKAAAKSALALPSKKFVMVWLCAAVLFGLGIFFFKVGKKPELMITETLRLSKSILPKENVKELSLAMAFRLVKAKQFAPAKRIFEEILATEPTNVSVLNNLAYIAGEEAELGRAAEYLQTAIQISDRCAECLNNLGSVLYKQQKIDEAKSMFERATAMDPRYADARLNLAVLYEELADWTSAADSYRQAESLVSEPEVKKWVAQRAAWLGEIAPPVAKRAVTGGGDK